MTTTIPEGEDRAPAPTYRKALQQQRRASLERINLDPGRRRSRLELGLVFKDEDKKYHTVVPGDEPSDAPASSTRTQPAATPSSSFPSRPQSCESHEGVGQRHEGIDHSEDCTFFESDDDDEVHQTDRVKVIHLTSHADDRSGLPDAGMNGAFAFAGSVQHFVPVAFSDGGAGAELQLSPPPENGIERRLSALSQEDAFLASHAQGYNPCPSVGANTASFQNKNTAINQTPTFGTSASTSLFGAGYQSHKPSDGPSSSSTSEIITNSCKNKLHPQSESPASATATPGLQYRERAADISPPPLPRSKVPESREKDSWCADVVSSGNTRNVDSITAHDKHQAVSDQHELARSELRKLQEENLLLQKRDSQSRRKSDLLWDRIQKLMLVVEAQQSEIKNFGGAT